MSVVNVPGEEFTFSGGQKLTIPPLSLGALEQLIDPINEVMSGAIDKKAISTIIDAVHAALKRNYPDMTREGVADLLDFSNMQRALSAVMSASGMEAVSEDPEGKVEAP